MKSGSTLVYKDEANGTETIVYADNSKDIKTFNYRVVDEQMYYYYTHLEKYDSSETLIESKEIYEFTDF